MVLIIRYATTPVRAYLCLMLLWLNGCHWAASSGAAAWKREHRSIAM